jgi:phage gp36-like protein
MYCTRANIEAMRLPRQNLIQLTDDEMLGEVDADDANSAINKRVQDAITNAVGEIHFYLSGRYAVPLDPVPEVITGICVALAVFNLFMRRNAVDVQNAIVDTALLGYNQAIDKLKMIAAGRLKLDAPTQADTQLLGSSDIVITEPRRFSNVPL